MNYIIVDIQRFQIFFISEKKIFFAVVFRTETNEGLSQVVISYSS